ncbi:MAG: tetratricopeptide repeat protein [Planctomycetes bacterium]|nr:tetratricopeptide repeat protein [Planctomycetota bacterium]
MHASHEHVEAGDRSLRAGDFTAALAAYRRALELAEDDPTGETRAEGFCGMAIAHLALGRIEEGRAWLERGREAVLPSAPRGRSRWLEAQARFAEAEGRRAEAAADFKACFEHAVSHGLAGRAVDAALAAGRVDEPSERIGWELRALRTAVEAGIEDRLASLWDGLASLYDASGRLDEALRARERARELHWRMGSEPDKLAADCAVGRAYRLCGRLDASRSMLRPALAWSERLYRDLPGPESARLLARACRELGEAELAGGRAAEGRALCERSFSLEARAVFEDSPVRPLERGG